MPENDSQSQKSSTGVGQNISLASILTSIGDSPEDLPKEKSKRATYQNQRLSVESTGCGNNSASDIYAKVFKGRVDPLMNFLMSSQGEMLLDREIIKAMQQIDDTEELYSFVDEFFKSKDNQSCSSLRQIVTQEMTHRQQKEDQSNASYEIETDGTENMILSDLNLGLAAEEYHNQGKETKQQNSSGPIAQGLKLMEDIWKDAEKLSDKNVEMQTIKEQLLENIDRQYSFQDTAHKTVSSSNPNSEDFYLTAQETDMKVEDLDQISSLFKEYTVGNSSDFDLAPHAQQKISKKLEEALEIINSQDCLQSTKVNQEHLMEEFQQVGEEALRKNSEKSAAFQEQSLPESQGLKKKSQSGTDSASVNNLKHSQNRIDSRTATTVIEENSTEQQQSGSLSATIDEEDTNTISSEDFTFTKTPLPENRWKVQFQNGDLYIGQFENQMKNGWGEYNYTTGEKYIGLFADDQIHGYGRYYFLGGAEYEGDWRSGAKHGIGILIFANKDVYQGGFVDDLFHGKGKYTSHNGDVFQGMWKNGQKHGKGVLDQADGNLQVGNWRNDKFQI